MFESANGISVQHLLKNRSFHIRKDDTAFCTFTRVQAGENVEHRFETSAATLCFVRGTGKIAINDRVVEYGGKWFEIPRKMEYQIYPETDTLMLTLQKPTRDSINMDRVTSAGAIYHSHPVS
jgi:hypothetical protein